MFLAKAHWGIYNTSRLAPLRRRLQERRALRLALDASYRLLYCIFFLLSCCVQMEVLNERSNDTYVPVIPSAAEAGMLPLRDI